MVAAGACGHQQMIDQRRGHASAAGEGYDVHAGQPRREVLVASEIVTDEERN